MNKIYKSIILSATLALGLTSCNDWLDVAPKSQLEEKDLFSRETGYNDQLVGVYSQMCNTSMYGLQETVGFAEILSQNYNINSNSTTWRYVRDYDYSNTNVEAILAGIWKGNYSCIANLNILLENIEKRSVLTSHLDSLYRGEAIGLRAFLHLELMRYFAAAPSMSTTANGVPYVTQYGTQVVGQKSVGETMQLIINDLETAYRLLKADIVCPESPKYEADTNDSKSRMFRFNYYACCATLARAYLYNGDKANALKYAQEVIDVNNAETQTNYAFSWVHYSVAQTTNKNDWQPSFYTEMIFRLANNDWEENGNKYLHAAMGADALSPTYDFAQEVYELNAGLGSDLRLKWCFEQDGADKMLSKLWYVDGRAANGYLPLIRMTESYLIAAECLADTDPVKAIGYINDIRTNRGLSSFLLSEELTSEQIKNEVYKEYRKEFLGEGQLFFYYKRLNATDIPGSSTKGSKAVYVMPIPSNDQEFGGYSN